MYFPRKAKEGKRTERFSSKLRLLLLFSGVLFSLIVLLSFLVDTGKGSVLISSQLTSLNFALYWCEMIWSVLSRIFFFTS